MKVLPATGWKKSRSQALATGQVRAALINPERIARILARATAGPAGSHARVTSCKTINASASVAVMDDSGTTRGEPSGAIDAGTPAEGAN